MHECTWCCWRCWCDGKDITRETRQPRDCDHFTREKPCLYIKYAHEDEEWEEQEVEDDR